jgi:hypothetical protein
MRVLTTPYVRSAMTPEDLAYIEQERPGRDGSTLSLLAKSPTGPFIARFYDPELGDFHETSATVCGAVAKVIAAVDLVA